LRPGFRPACADDMPPPSHCQANTKSIPPRQRVSPHRSGWFLDTSENRNTSIPSPRRSPPTPRNKTNASGRVQSKHKTSTNKPRISKIPENCSRRSMGSRLASRAALPKLHILEGPDDMHDFMAAAGDARNFVRLDLRDSRGHRCGHGQGFPEAADVFSQICCRVVQASKSGTPGWLTESGPDTTADRRPGTDTGLPTGRPPRNRDRTG